MYESIPDAGGPAPASPRPPRRSRGGRRRVIRIAAGATAGALLLAGCAQVDDGAGDSTGGSTLIAGTTDKVVNLDPAGAYDNGSTVVHTQVYPYLLTTPYNSPDPVPDIAESAEFTAPKDYTVKLKPDLTWANGNTLDANDVKFTFDRMVAINDPNGPASLLGNLDSTEVTDDTTVVFHLKSENDQTWPQILTSPAGPIVDDEVFSAGAITPAADIVAAKAFGGQYQIDSYEENSLIAYTPNPNYVGALGEAANAGVQAKYYADSANLKLDVQEGNIDVAFRSLSPTDVEDLGTQDDVQIIEGPDGELRYIVFNFDTMPYGAKASEADPAKALAVRQAMADVVDRQAISDQVYKGTYTPVYSHVPSGLTGAIEPLKDLYGDGSGGPDVAKATEVLTEAGVDTPVAIQLQYNPDHYGESSGDEYALVKSQLESSGLFTVDLQATEWVTYNTASKEDAYPVYQLGWFPDYSDADNYLTPFFVDGGFLANHYNNDEVERLIAAQVAEPDPAKRTDLIEQIQQQTAADLPTLPLLQGNQVAVAGTGVSGIVLDASFRFRYAPITK